MSKEKSNTKLIPCIPFMSELKCVLSGITEWDFWHDPEQMAQAEITVFEQFHYDRIVIGPNTRGIMEAMGGEYVYSEEGAPSVGEIYLKDYSQLNVGLG